MMLLHDQDTGRYGKMKQATVIIFHLLISNVHLNISYMCNCFTI